MMENKTPGKERLLYWLRISNILQVSVIPPSIKVILFIVIFTRLIIVLAILFFFFISAWLIHKKDLYMSFKIIHLKNLCCLASIIYQISNGIITQLVSRHLFLLTKKIIFHIGHSKSWSASFSLLYLFFSLKLQLLSKKKNL